MKRSIGWVAVTLTVVALSACSDQGSGSASLSSGNQAVCNAAHAENARTVYNVRNQPEDKKLKELARRIYPGSSTKTDHDAISDIKERCKRLGYRAP